MRLINIYTLELEEFINDPPRYAALSHRWMGAEITYEEYCDPRRCKGPGYRKIVDFCAFLRSEEFRKHSINIPFATERRSVTHAWVDTACIDKRSSSELSEAINSMWNWYGDSAVCIAFLHDVKEASPLKDSELFKRGWTLQELLAPYQVVFCDSEWNILGTKGSLVSDISAATGIPHSYLEHTWMVMTASVAQRMSWASQRQTTRGEDMAYCLFGLFRVNMPLIYGEGGFRAFGRLQEEIIRRSNDESIISWTAMQRLVTRSGILAESPADFALSHDTISWKRASRTQFSVTNNGLEIRAPLLKVQQQLYLLELNCVSVQTRQFNGDRGVQARECVIALQRCECGAFTRMHWSDMRWWTSQYISFENKIIPETLIYIHTDLALHSKNKLYDEEQLVILGENALFYGTFEMEWYKKVKAQPTRPDLFDLEGHEIVPADEQTGLRRLENDVDML